MQAFVFLPSLLASTMALNFGAGMKSVSCPFVEVHVEGILP